MGRAPVCGAEMMGEMNKETCMRLPRVKESRLVLGALGLATLLGAIAGPAGAQEQTAVFVASDQANVLTVGPEPLNKVVVANPNVADVQVLNPTQLLLTGKT